ncbi:MAG: glutathione S-transferase family protein [Pseudomonadales bacterium]
MIQLYGRGQSRSFRALWALEESGLEYEYINVQPGGDVPSHYRTINSQGKVPTLVDGEVTLTESGAIVNYLASKAVGTGLIPQDITLRARYDEIAFFVMSDLEQPLWSIGKHRFVLPEEVRQPGMAETAKYEFARSHRALHHHMHGRDYAVGESFTMADILLAHTIAWAKRFEMKVDKPFIEYQEKMYARPACKKSLIKLEANR